MSDTHDTMICACGFDLVLQGVGGNPSLHTCGDPDEGGGISDYSLPVADATCQRCHRDFSIGNFSFERVACPHCGAWWSHSDLEARPRHDRSRLPIEDWERVQIASQRRAGVPFKTIAKRMGISHRRAQYIQQRTRLSQAPPRKSGVLSRISKTWLARWIGRA